MLRELLTALATPASLPARRLGHVRESVAIEARWRRCREAWAGHLEQCRAAVLDAAGAGGGTAVVLGSGALLDVPLAELAERFARVLLLDVVHPLRTRRLAARLPPVRLVPWDLLGLSDAAGLAGAPERLGAWRRDLPPPDLVISANLLTQLPLKPLDRWGGGLADPEGWARRVMAAHLADLAGGPGRALLLSEFRRHWLDRRGQAAAPAEKPVAGLDLPAPWRRWTWELAPFGELDRDHRLVLEVGAFFAGANGLPPVPARSDAPDLL